MRLTKEELEVLDHLVNAHNLFVALSDKCQDDEKEFSTLINGCQKIIALRVARRVDKEIWTQP